MKFTRHGFKELLIGTAVLVTLAAALGYFELWVLAALTVPVLLWLWAFFRDPERTVPPMTAGDNDDGGRATMVSPADGKVSDVTDLERDPVLGEPSVRVGIFLSVFNVHVNRAPCDGVVEDVTYKKGKFVNAMSHGRASDENESNTILIRESGGAGRGVAVVKQIVGLIARRIICTKEPGDPVHRGERIGMIKFGSRTELSIPKRLHPKILVEVGQKVRAGLDLIAEVDGHGVGGAGEVARSTPATATVADDSEMEPLATPTPA